MRRISQRISEGLQVCPASDCAFSADAICGTGNMWSSKLRRRRQENRETRSWTLCTRKTYWLSDISLRVAIEWSLIDRCKACEAQCFRTPNNYVSDLCSYRRVHRFC